MDLIHSKWVKFTPESQLIALEFIQPLLLIVTAQYFKQDQECDDLVYRNNIIPLFILIIETFATDSAAWSNYSKVIFK